MPNTRPEVLDGVPLRHAPSNELGVVFLFAHLAKKWRLRVDEIRPGFPDCIAYQKIGGKERKIRIEFEFKSKNFKTHGHQSRGCDWIVCWEHNWPDAPNSVRVVELRREFGLGFNVWIMPTTGDYKEVISSINADARWSVPSQAHKDDLILYYLTKPETKIQDLFLTKDRAKKVSAGWKAGKDYMAPIRRVCKLKSPIHLEDFRRHKILGTAPFIRGSMQGRPKVTEYWPEIYDLILRRNPAVKKQLAKFAPDRLQ